MDVTEIFKDIRLCMQDFYVCHFNSQKGRLEIGLPLDNG